MAIAMVQPQQWHERSWDEEIVPALRKRLESESLAITKRMSGQSLKSADDGQNANAILQWRSRYPNLPPVPPTPTYQFTNDVPDPVAVDDFTGRTPKASGIPRPSMSSNNYRSDSSSQSHGSKPSIDSTFGQSQQQQHGPQVTRQRARTVSTPQPFDREFHNGKSQQRTTDSQNGLPTPVSSRSNSPHNQPAPSSSVASTMKVPKSRIPRPNPILAVGYINEPIAIAVTTDSPRLYPPQFNQSDILREQSMALPSASDYSTPRESMEDERPYEHWYRGDISRSGGVGELTMVKRKQMLEIANYGHARSLVVESRPNSGLDAMLAERGVRMRSGSLSERESLYNPIADESIGRAVTDWVIDEIQLTDGEWSGAENSERPTPSEAGFSSLGVTPARGQNSSLSSNARRPGANPPGGDGGMPGRSFSTPVIQTIQTKGLAAPAGKKSPATPGSGKTPTGMPHGYGNAQSASQVSLSKKRARGQSPGAASASSAKRSKDGKSPLPSPGPSPGPLGGGGLAPPISGAGKGRDEKHYSMLNAVPSYTVPVPKDGKWDEVVLPAVARQMGLEGYETVSGHTPEKPREPEPPEPAPGTFGFDYSKYKPPRPDRPETLTEFGEDRPSLSAGSTPVDGRSPRLTVAQFEAPEVRPVSPAPFSSYRVSVEPQQPIQQQQYHYVGGQGSRPGYQNGYANGHQPHQQFEEKRRREEEEDAGCCKCVIM